MAKAELPEPKLSVVITASLLVTVGKREGES
jgi:hypothetical protein